MYATVGTCTLLKNVHLLLRSTSAAPLDTASKYMLMYLYFTFTCTFNTTFNIRYFEEIYSSLFVYVTFTWINAIHFKPISLLLLKHDFLVLLTTLPALISSQVECLTGQKQSRWLIVCTCRVSSCWLNKQLQKSAAIIIKRSGKVHTAATATIT